MQINPKLLMMTSIWPNPTYLGLSVPKMLEDYNNKNISHDDQNYNQTLQHNLIEYIYSIVQNLEFKFQTFYLSIVIARKYLSKVNQQKQQLIAMVSLFLASKLLESNCISLNMIHKYSNHAFTNKQILSCEQKILQTFNYNIIFREQNLDDYVKVLYEIVKHLLPNDIPYIHNSYIKTIESVLFILLKEQEFLKELGDMKLIGSAIIITCLIILSQSNGRFPITCRLAVLLKISENQIQLASLKILKVILGKNVYKQLDF